MSDQRCIIIGASHAAAQLAPALRQNGWKGTIAVVGNEYSLPYHRPPLSKDFLSGKKSSDDILIRQPGVYEKAQIKFALGMRATQLDAERQVVLLDNNVEVPYDKLVLCTGAHVRRLNIPGSDLPGIMYLRNIDDVHHIKSFVGKDKKAVIVGGGYIGLETAASLRKLGMEVTVLEAMSRVLQRVTAPEISAFYTRVHNEEGVNIVTDTIAKSFEGNKHVEAVVCENGDRFEADLVIVGVGVIPSTELAESAGLEVNNGIVVDEYARTSNHNILAAGDCTSHWNPIYERQLRLESVQNALDQASVAANTICGNLKPYHALPWFWSDQYDLKLQIAGLNQGFEKVVIRGDITSGRNFAAFYLQGNRLLAVDAINKPQEYMIGRRLITEKVELDEAKLADPDVPMKELLG